MQYTQTTEHEVKHIIRQILVLAAQHLNIPHPQLEDSFVLYDEIKKTNEKLYTLLHDFSEAYLNFYYTTSNLSNTKKSAVVNDSHKDLIRELFEKKEKLKKEILKEILG